MFDTDQAPAPSATSCEDAVGTYLRQIARYPRLTRAQELALAKRAVAGDEAARRRLVESNLRLVVSIARTYRSGTLELLDLVQEGTLGLMRAVELYDWRRGNTLSTYASRWIRHRIQRAIARGDQTIRVPESIRDRIGAVHTAERVLMSSLGRTLTSFEIARSLGVKVELVHEARAAEQPLGSLDAALDGQAELDYGDVVADLEARDPLQLVLDNVPPIDIDAGLARLSERSRQ